MVSGFKMLTVWRDLPVLESGMIEVVFAQCSLPLRPRRDFIHVDVKQKRKASALRKVFILEQPRICNMATIRKKSLFPPSNSKALTTFLDPKGAYYLILSHL